MYRLAELTDSQRLKAGTALLVLGTLMMGVAVVWVHYSGLPPEQFVDGQSVPLVVEPAIFNEIPRGWLPKSLGYLVAFGASQMMVIGAFFVWVLNKPMTWARASIAATLTWMELVILFGIVPSEWLNLSQTDLDWSPQRIAFDIPSWLVLGNDISISYAAIKDAISAGYNTGLLVAAPVFAIMVQKIKDGRPAKAAAEEPKSPYGRPLRRGDS
ncbi:MAG: hypothetical protein R3246_08660 [Acidimicrobiia bacterium]|nr:hypothetical protein [Acidimicrobiia bacterium]